MLVDGGPERDGAVRAVSGELAFWDKSLDMVVLTHLDADHSRGLLEVLNRFRVGGVLVGSENVDAPLRARVEAAWVDDAEMKPNLASIRHFRPLSEAASA